MTTPQAAAVDAAAAITMPWGVHRGKTVADLPSSYLKWLAAECRDEKICAAADAEWRWRDKSGAHTEEG